MEYNNRRTTYCFDVGILSSLSYFDLIAANSISIGAQLYEWGPKNITGMLRYYIVYKVSFDKWYGAPSINTIVSFRHLGLSLSSCFVRWYRYNENTKLSVFYYVNDAYKLPILSNAIIIDILGATCFLGLEFISEISCQQYLL